MNDNSLRISPFLRWPGGKRWLLKTLATKINSDLIENYYEPFLGGGAIFFHFRFKKSYLTDVNYDLINAYINVRDQHDKLIKKLKTMPNDRVSYNKFKAMNSSSNAVNAARFLYLNRMAFSGMYRVNKMGIFNVPYGGDKSLDFFWSNDLLKNCSLALSSATIECCDFSKMISKAGVNDLVFCDPPYTVTHSNSGFKRYNESIFSWQDQIRLRDEIFKAVDRGAEVILTNAADQEIANLYHPFSPQILARHSDISRRGKSEGVFSEYIFYLKK